MDIEKLIEQLKSAAGGPEGIKMCHAAATALSMIPVLQAENDELKAKLYDGEGVNLVDYWMQQAQIEENGHKNCQAENERLRDELDEKEKYYDQMIDALAATDRTELDQMKRENETLKHALQNWHEEV